MDGDDARGARAWPLEIALVGLVALGAFAIRTVPARPAVFEDDWVRFQGIDSWYHLRLIDAVVADYPNHPTFDPLAITPGGRHVTVHPLFDVAVATVARLLGAGPGDPRVDVVAAYASPVLGAVAVLGVYLLGRRCWGRVAGLTAAAGMACLPGHGLVIGLLGRADHHALEVVCALATLLAIESLAETAPDAGLRTRGRRMLFAGAAIACYVLTWSGAPLPLAILAAWGALRVTLEHHRGSEPGDLAAALAGAGIVAAAVLAPFAAHLSRGELLVSTLGALVLLPGALHGLLARFPGRGRPLPIAVGAAIVGIGLAAITAPGLLTSARGALANLTPSELSATIAEARPLWLADGGAGRLLWTDLRWLSLLGLTGLAIEVSEPGDGRRRSLVLVWSLAILALTALRVRFLYYLALAASLFAGRAIARAIEWTGDRLDGRRRIAARLAVGAIAAAGILSAIPIAVTEASRQRGLDPIHRDAFLWLRDHTPPPLGTVDAYPNPPFDRDALESAYGVLTSWDYGYLLIRVGQRIPTAMPAQLGMTETAGFLTAVSPEAATEHLDATRAAYVVTSSPMIDLPRRAGGFATMLRWAGRDPSAFFEDFQVEDPERGWRPVRLYRPAYFRTPAVHLHLSGGEAVEAGPTWVVRWAPATSGSGEEYRVVRDRRWFSTPEEAQEFARSVRERGGTRLALGSFDPTSSPVDLAAYPGLDPVYRSPHGGDRLAGGQSVPPVRIFRRTGERRATPPEVAGADRTLDEREGTQPSP